MLDTPRVRTGAASKMPSPTAASSEAQDEARKHVVHYVYSPGQDIGLADRRVSVTELHQGEITPIVDFPYLDKNQSPEYIKSGGQQYVTRVKSALDSANEIEQGLAISGAKRAFILHSITGVDPEVVEHLEFVIVPEAETPATLKKRITYLRTKSRDNIANADLPKEARDLAEKLRAEMQKADEAAFRFQHSYLDRTERELINSRKPNGRGKSSLDDVDKFYYRMTERKVPLETDLDFVAEAESAETEGNKEAGILHSGPLADALNRIADLVGQRSSPSDYAPDEEVVRLREEVSTITDKFNQLVEMIQTGKVKVPAKGKSSTE